MSRDFRLSVWYHLAAALEPVSVAPQLDALAREGVVARAREDGSASGPGLLFFDGPMPGLYERLRELSRGGMERVLAVALERSALEPTEVWRLLRCGASEVCCWNGASTAEMAAARLERWAAVDRLVNSPLVQRNLIGSSTAWTMVLRQVVEVGSFTDASVLITGESGTGKELVARLIHSLDPRSRKKELVVLDCTTVVPELAGSEFFGHERGAFTGAVGPRDGAFALADGGTLFLDEVGELPLGMQAQLLRVVQEGTYKRVGGNVWHRASFRLVCATNRDLLEEVARGRFRADLYYRIASVPCHLPPLRDRPDDVIPLFRHFLSELRPEEEPPPLDEAVRDHLLRRRYPGNVRDLRQLASRVAYRHVGSGPVTAGDMPEDERPDPGEGSGGPEDWRDPAFDEAVRRALAQGYGLKGIGRLVSEAAIQIAVGDAGGNLQRAAQRLGVTDRALQMRKAARRISLPGIAGEPSEVI